MKELPYKYCCRLKQNINSTECRFVVEILFRYGANDIQIQHKYCINTFVIRTHAVKGIREISKFLRSKFDANIKY